MRTSMNNDTTTEEPRSPPGEQRAAPRLVIAFEAGRAVAAEASHLLSGVQTVLCGRGTHRRTERRVDHSPTERQLLLDIPDRWMSGSHASLRLALGRWVIEDLKSRNGTFVNGKRLTRALELNDGDVIELGHTFVVFRSSAPVEPGAVEQPPDNGREPGLITLRPALDASLRSLERVAPNRGVFVMLRGETGTGKEVIARALHKLSGRTGKLQAVNCAAIPEALVESELFGSVRGAFTGAEERAGLVRTSDGGTLFLDEIGDFSLSSQASLLRVLEQQEVTPVGGTKPIKVDLRVVSATHRDLEEMVQQGKFRQDLLARLTGFTLTLPPLRERREDLGLLTSALLTRHLEGRAAALTFGQLAARALFVYGWPLNIRELEKALTRAAALADENQIEVEDLPDELQKALDEPPDLEEEPPLPPGKPVPPGELDRYQLVLELLKKHKGNVTAVAREMKKARMQIQRWLKRYSINRAEFL